VDLSSGVLLAWGDASFLIKMSPVFSLQCRFPQRRSALMTASRICPAAAMPSCPVAASGYLV
jgi:hypothetical protein